MVLARRIGDIVRYVVLRVVITRLLGPDLWHRGGLQGLRRELQRRAAIASDPRRGSADRAAT